LRQGTAHHGLLHGERWQMHAFSVVGAGNGVVLGWMTCRGWKSTDQGPLNHLMRFFKESAENHCLQLFFFFSFLPRPLLFSNLPA
jgi:hypothetical protein